MRKSTVLIAVFALLVQSFVFAEPARKLNNPEVLDRISREVVASHDQTSANRFDEREKTAWRSRHPIAFGSLVGLGIGFSIGLFIGITGEDTDAAGAALLFGAIGAGIGAFIGSFAEYRKTPAN